MKNLIVAFLTFAVATMAYAQDGEFHLDKDYKISPSGTLDLRSSDAKVFITGTDRATAHVKIDRRITAKGWTWGGGDFNVEVEESGGDLFIREHEIGSHVGVVGYYHEDYRIDIEVPAGISLKVRGDDGDYYIKNVDGSIRLSLDDADAELTGCDGSEFEFRLDDGDVRMDGGRGSLDVTADDGDIDVHHGDFTSIHARLDDGDLTVETNLHDDGSYYLESEDGTIALRITSGGGAFDIRHDDARVITEGEFNVIEKDDRETLVELPKGKAKVDIRADDARVRLSTL